MLREEIKRITDNAALEAFKNGEIVLSENNNVSFAVEVPKNYDFGDFAVNVSSLARFNKCSPVTIAQKIEKHINSPNFETSVAGGFINFKVKNCVLEDILKEVCEKKQDFGKNNFGEEKRVILEYVSANPTGPFHIGHGRWAAVGSALAKILEFCGYKVFQEFYINDAGNQINNLARSLHIRILHELGNRSLDFPYEDPVAIKSFYSGEYLVDVAKKFVTEQFEFAKSLTENPSEEELNILGEFAKKELLLSQKRTLEKFRTYFDNFFSEMSLHKNGDVEKCVKFLQKNGKIYEKEGALWFKSSEYGDDQDRVIKKTDGSNTYLTADIAYHLNKIERGFDLLINIWGADHHGYIPRVKASIEALGYNPNCLEIILGQLVNLIVSGEQMRMGKRSKMLTLNDLIDEVGVDATRFWMIMRNCDLALDFDVDLAKSSNDENPVFYVQYAHARACSILRHAKEVGKISKEGLDTIIENSKNINYSLLFSEDDKISFNAVKRLVLKLEEFKFVVVSSAKNRSPYIVCKYLQELSALFHQFYNLNRVISENNDLTISRLLLVKSFISVMRIALSLISIDAPEKM